MAAVTRALRRAPSGPRANGGGTDLQFKFRFDVNSSGIGRRYAGLDEAALNSQNALSQLDYGAFVIPHDATLTSVFFSWRGLTSASGEGIQIGVEYGVNMGLADYLEGPNYTFDPGELVGEGSLLIETSFDMPKGYVIMGGAVMPTFACTGDCFLYMIPTLEY